jgi:NAD(P)-dependent dehydrogenase (short-subunit alcohol dehydrogenase family)
VAEEITENYTDAKVDVRELDLTSLKSVKVFAEGFPKDYDRLDVLINNAGIMMCPYDKTQDGLEIQMGTNHFGHFALTRHLLPLLQSTPKSRIVVTSSAAHNMGNIDFSDINWESRKYKTSRAYGDSKLANLYFTYELANKLSDDGSNPMVVAAHPGWTSTELQRHSGFFQFMNNFFAQNSDMGILPSLMAAVDEDAKPGDYYGPSGMFEMQGYPVKVKSNKRSHDKRAATELWRLSEDLTGVKY